MTLIQTTTVLLSLFQMFAFAGRLADMTLSRRQHEETTRLMQSLDWSRAPTRRRVTQDGTLARLWKRLR